MLRISLSLFANESWRISLWNKTMEHFLWEKASIGYQLQTTCSIKCSGFASTAKLLSLIEGSNQTPSSKQNKSQNCSNHKLQHFGFFAPLIDGVCQSMNTLDQIFELLNQAIIFEHISFRIFHFERCINDFCSIPLKQQTSNFKT